jgi:hypothetical protein
MVERRAGMPQHQGLRYHDECSILVARINAPRINTRHPQNLISRFDALLWELKAYHEVTNGENGSGIPSCSNCL